MTITTASRQIASIAKALEDSLSSDIIKISEKENGILEIQKHEVPYIAKIFQPITNVIINAIIDVRYNVFGNVTPCNETIAYFQKVFGVRRIERIDKKWGLDLLRKSLDQNSSLSKLDLEKIFASVNEITLEDLRELLEEIKNPSIQNVRFFDEKRTTGLYLKYKNLSSIEEASATKIKELIKILAPFSKLEHIFLSKVPTLKKFSESSLEELQSRVFVYNSLKNISRRDPLFSLSLAKDLSGRSLPKGALIPYKDGFLANIFRIKTGGACKYFLKTLGQNPFKFPNIILYRGTSVTEFSAVRDCIRRFIGFEGSRASREKTNQYLDPKKGFVSSLNEKVHAIGMSLGGAHAQLDVCAMPNRFSKVTTVCSPGISQATIKLFNQYVPNQLVHIDHFIEKSDVIDELGEAHLGAWSDNKNINLYKILDETSFDRIQCPKSLWKAVFTVMKIAQGPHIFPAISRDMTLEKSTTQNSKEEQAIKAHLEHESPYIDPLWEIWRKFLLHIFSLPSIPMLRIT